MPEVVVYIMQGRSLDQKRGLVKEITDAVVKNCGVPADAVVVQIVESPFHDKARGGILFSDRRAQQQPPTR
jgi:4-oxalocrotonate tautomerase